MAFDPKALEKLIEKGGVPFKVRKHSYVLTCPRCGKGEKLWILRHNGHFVCWYCKEIDGYQGRGEFALRDLYGKSLEELRALLYGSDVFDPSVGLLLDLVDFYGEDDGDLVLVSEVEKLEEIAWPEDTFPIDDPRAYKGKVYLHQRGIPLDVALEYGLRFWPQKRRVMFPVEADGKLYGYQGRTTGATEWVDKETGEVRTVPKILTSTGLRRDRIVMFADRLKGCDHAVLCEGPVDALKAHLCGGNVATMGKAVSKQQLGLLRASGVKKVYLALDPDAAEEARLLARELGDLELYDLQPPPGRGDLGECTMEEVLEAFRAAPLIRPGHLFVYVKDPFDR
jgi:hypothetical protein